MDVSMLVPKVDMENLVKLKRATIETLYSARVTVWTQTNEENARTHFQEVKKHVICKDEPCRITGQLSDPVEGYPKEFVKRVNLMLAPEWIIPEGSYIEVTYNGYKKLYRLSAPPYHYSDHQTISLLEADEERGVYA